MHGLDNFEGRSSVRTWVFRILVNRGKTRGVRDARTVPMASLGPEDLEGDAVDPSRFRGAGDQWPGRLASGSAHRSLGNPLPRTMRSPERSAVALRRLCAELPERQRVVVSLRDVHGMDGEEVCDLLGLSQANQRVLLHRGRAKLRQSLGGLLPARWRTGGARVMTEHVDAEYPDVPCQDFVELITDYLEGVLDSRDDRPRWSTTLGCATDVRSTSSR